MMKTALSLGGLYALCSALVLAPTSSQGTDYYVSTSGSDSNPGTSAQPFRTITHAYGYAAAGVTIHVAPGVYTDYTSGWGIHLGSSGTASSPIVLRSDVRGGAIIDGQNASDRNEGFYIDGNYNVVDGFEIRNCPNGGISIWSNGNQILNNHIHNNGNPASTSTNGKDGVYSNEGTSGNIYEANYIDHNGRTGSNLDHGLYLCGQNEVVANNVLLANAATGLQVAGYTTVSNMKVYNNVMAWNGTCGIILWQSLNGVDIKNNIIYQNGHYGIGSYAATGSGVVADHNLVYGNGSGSFDFTGGGSTYSYSLGTSLNTDPGLVNETSTSFDPHLASGSPAIQAGLNLSSAITTDMSGAARPSSGPWDLGAYASTVASPANVTVAATTPNASRVGPSNGVFTISRSGATTQALTVNCTLGGTATNGGDYATVGTAWTIPAGAASASITVAPLPSTGFVGSKSVVLTLASGSGYSVSSPQKATVTIGGNSLRTTIGKAPGNNAKLTWASQAGKAYRVAYKNSLTDTAWTDLSSLSATSTSTSYTDTAASTKTQRFYIVYVTN